MDRPDEVIWQLGDTWCDLRPAISAAGTATIITAHLTTHLLDLHQHRATRMTSVLSSVLTGDGDVRTLIEVEVATPCGLVTRCDPIERSQMSTPLVLALTGLHPDWDENHLPRLIEQAAHIEPGRPHDHPSEDCRALYCPGSISLIRTDFDKRPDQL